MQLKMNDFFRKLSGCDWCRWASAAWCPLVLVIFFMLGGKICAGDAVRLPPLKMKRAAVYIVPPAVKAAPVMPLDWLEKELKTRGVVPVRIGEAGLPGLPESDFDILIMPFPVMSLECEDAVFRYLASGRSVMAVSCCNSVFKPDGKGVPQPTLKGDIYKNHSRGWYAPFLIRNLDPGWKWARRQPRKALRRDAGAAGIVGNLLPEKAGPYPNLSYTPMDRWNVISGGDGGYGKGINYGLAGDVTLNLYRERRGIPADFFIHRYFNTAIFGGTFIQLGKVGCRLLASPQGGDVFKALLHLSELPLPKEQPREFYQDSCRLRHRWADYSFAYIEMISRLQNTLIAARLDGDSGDFFQTSLNQIQVNHGVMAKLYQKYLDYLLKTPADPECTATLQNLNRKLSGAEKLYQDLEAQSDRVLKRVKIPEKPAVANPYGRLQLIASLTLPVNLNRLRGGFFDELKRMDGTAYSWNFHEWYIADPQVQKKMRGISLDHKFVYIASADKCVGMGRYNPVDGSVTETPAVVYPYDYIRGYLAKLFKLCDDCGIRQFRIGTGDETGLGFNYWGEPAAREFRQTLEEYYGGNLAGLNAHCGTAFRSFEEIRIPCRQPVLPSEHALWEHWRRCRENKLEYVYRTFYEEIKKIRPGLDVFHLPSTGSMRSPLYGLNLYNASRYEDVNGLDGTTCAVPQEWQVYDLTRKPLLTSEWGGVYTDRSGESLYSQMWQEVTGGTLGFELHSFSWGSDSISFIDQLNLKNIRGALIRKAMHDTRRVEHVLLDGRRAVPEIGILFSQTARMHDQGWGMKGESTRSAHMDTVSNYYGLFLKFHRSARVYSEEHLLEGTLPPVKCLIVPQARYLSEKVQKGLLEYVRAGGSLILEGRCGQFDEFGRKSDVLFREAGIVPRYTEGGTFICEGRRFGIAEKADLFSPSGKGKTLAWFGENPAIHEVLWGRGRIIAAGLPLGLRQYAFFAGVLEHVLRHAGITPRFMVSDDSILSREWVYGKDTYLMLVSYDSDWNLKEHEIKIRGRVQVEDYLFGRMISTEFRNGYTVFTTLLGAGGRVFRLKNSAPAPLPYAPAFAEGRCHPLASAKGGKSDVRNISLPYRGRLYDDTPLVWEDVVFSLTTVAAGDGADRGETYLTVEADGLSRKKFIEVKKDVFFRVGKRIFKIHSFNNFCKYPFHCELSIEAVENVPPPAPARRLIRNKHVILENDALELSLDSSNIAAITSLLLKDRHSEQIASYNKKAAFIVSGNMPGVFWGRGCRIDELSPQLKPGDAGAGFALRGEAEHLMLRQEYVMKPDQAGFCLMAEARQNADAASKGFEIHWHPELCIGGGAEKGDVFYFPQKNGVKTVPFQGIGAGRTYPVARPWSAVVDTEQRLAYISEVRSGNVKAVYIWDGKEFYTMELMTPRITEEPRVSRLEFGCYFVRGMTGMDDWKDGIALHVPVAPSVNQLHSQAFTVELGTSSLVPRTGEIQMEIYRDKDRIFAWKPVRGQMVFDQAMVESFSYDMSRLPDGDYNLAVRAVDGGGRVLAKTVKTVRLRGRQLQALMQEYEALKKRLTALENDSGTDVFKLQTEVEELRQHISSCNLPAARAMVSQLKKSLK